MAVLIMEQGPEVGKTFPLDAEEVTLGRSSGNDIVLPLSTISRRHARVRREDDSFILEDLQSTNGTFLNGDPVTRGWLAEGDRIKLGQAVLRFSGAIVETQELAVELLTTGHTMETSAVLERVEVGAYDVLAAEPPTGVAALQERLTFISQLRVELLQVLDAHELAPRVAQRLLEVFPKAEQALVALAEEKTDALSIQAARRPGGEVVRKIALSQTILRLVTDEREALLCADVRADARFRDRPSVVGARIRSFLCVPLVCRGEFLGVIYMDSQRPSARFEREDLLLATDIAEQVALAASNIRLHRSEVARERQDLGLALAEQVQQSFLPASNPDIPGMTFAPFYSPAFEVGGDFYNFISLGDDRWLVVVGDASGKGIPAALMMAKLTGDIRYHTHRGEPGRVLSELNQSLVGPTESRFVGTLLCLEVAVDTRQIVVASAGHPPPLVCPSGGEPYLFTEAGGAALGVFPGERYQEVTLTLSPGDCLLAYSDGVIEAMNSAGVVFGNERLLEAAAETTSAGLPLDPQGLIDQVLLVLRSFRGDVASTDDLPMVAVRWD